MNEFLPVYKKLLREPLLFCRHASRTTLRRYQRGVMQSIVDSVLNRRGLSFVIIFPRQSGKNELQAQLEVYLLTLFSNYPVEMIKVSPTLEPQALNAMRRFERVARRNILLEKVWKKEAGNSYRIGQARITFLSGAPESNIVGATASGLLEVDEAQEVTLLKYDRDISPMTASVCATRAFWGTAWTASTLLGRELRAARAAEARDGVQRVFLLTAEDVAKEVSAYRKHVEERVALLGRTHPLVRTQYFSEEIDSAGGMFPEQRVEKMRAAQPVLTGASSFALLLDVAGEDEGMRGIQGSLELANPRRDATALTLVEVGFTESSGKLPVYIPRLRWQWVGVNHTQLHPQIRDIALQWKARALVVDATGVGVGLASFLERSLPGRVIPFTFNSSSKSKLGWDFLGIVDSGRWHEPQLADPIQLKYQGEFFEQLAACQFEVSNGPEQRMRWQVPEGSRSPVSGEALHDDWIISAALSGVLDAQDWSAPAAPLLISAADPLKEMEGKY